MSLTFGSLFAGIGGFDLGFERAGMQCKWQVEIDEFCRKVLAKHWPDVRRWDDVRTFPPEPIDEWRVDVICGGFPCQDISNAYNVGQRGLDGERSGLWFEFARIIRRLRPKYAVVENTAAITFRGLDRVLGSLAECGYDAEWDMLSAHMLGAPQLRRRMFIVAYANGGDVRAPRTPAEKAASTGLPYIRPCEARRLESWWAMEPEPCSVAYGVPGIVDRLRPYGNAVVPQVAEWIGRRIVEAAQ